MGMNLSKLREMAEDDETGILQSMKFAEWDWT